MSIACIDCKGTKSPTKNLIRKYPPGFPLARSIRYGANVMVYAPNGIIDTIVENVNIIPSLYFLYDNKITMKMARVPIIVM